MSYLSRIYEKELPFFSGEPKMTALECAIWFTSQGTNAIDMESAAAELAAKDAETAALRERVKALEETGNKLVSLALSFNEDDPWIFERYDGVEIVSSAQAALRGEA